MIFVLSYLFHQSTDEKYLPKIMHFSPLRLQDYFEFAHFKSFNKKSVDSGKKLYFGSASLRNLVKCNPHEKLVDKFFEKDYVFSISFSFFFTAIKG